VRFFVGITLLLVKHVTLMLCFKAITDCPAFENTTFFNPTIINSTRNVITPLVSVRIRMNDCEYASLIFDLRIVTVLTADGSKLGG